MIESFLNWAAYGHPVLQMLLAAGMLALTPLGLILTWIVIYWGFCLTLSLCMAMFFLWAAIFSYLPGTIGGFFEWYCVYGMAIPFQLMGWMDSRVPLLNPISALPAVKNTFKKLRGTLLAIEHSELKYNEITTQTIPKYNSKREHIGWEKQQAEKEVIVKRSNFKSFDEYQSAVISYSTLYNLRPCNTST